MFQIGRTSTIFPKATYWTDKLLENITFKLAFIMRDCRKKRNKKILYDVRKVNKLYNSTLIYLDLKDSYSEVKQIIKC